MDKATTEERERIEALLVGRKSGTDDAATAEILRLITLSAENFTDSHEKIAAHIFRVADALLADPEVGPIYRANGLNAEGVMRIYSEGLNESRLSGFSFPSIMALVVVYSDKRGVEGLFNFFRTTAANARQNGKEFSREAALVAVRFFYLTVASDTQKAFGPGSSEKDSPTPQPI